MLNRLSMVALCLLAASPTVTMAEPVHLSANGGRGADEEVRQFIFRYNGYYAANDLDNYFAVFDPQLTQWWPSGRVDLVTYQKMWRALVASGGGMSKAVVSDLRVQVGPSGDAAVATYILEVTPRKNGKSDRVTERNQETDVLFRRHGLWKIVHINYGPAPPLRQ